MRSVHSHEITVWSINQDFVFFCFVGFEAFEALYGIVESCVHWVEMEIFVSFDNRMLPAALVSVVVDVQHVVCGDSSEHILVVSWRLRLKILSFHEFNVACLEKLEA